MRDALATKVFNDNGHCSWCHRYIQDQHADDCAARLLVSDAGRDYVPRSELEAEREEWSKVVGVTHPPGSPALKPKDTALLKAILTFELLPGLCLFILPPVGIQFQIKRFHFKSKDRLRLYVVYPLVGKI